MVAQNSPTTANARQQQTATMSFAEILLDEASDINSAGLLTLLVFSQLRRHNQGEIVDEVSAALEKVEEDPMMMKVALDSATMGVIQSTFPQACCPCWRRFLCDDSIVLGRRVAGGQLREREEAAEKSPLTTSKPNPSPHLFPTQPPQPEPLPEGGGVPCCDGVTSSS